MRIKSFLNTLLLFLAATVLCSHDSVENLASFSGNNLPADFIFGTASSAYQYEGAANEDGRGPSIWDTFTQKYPDKIKDHRNGNIAVDSYHRYKEDVALIKSLGFDAYRFSISWPRLLPRGHLNMGINQKGIDYYNDLINELLLNGIKPFVTLFHWDLPQALEDEYGGFLSSKIVRDFREYAELCFRKYGDRVKHWITLNEPLSYARDGYATGEKAPGRCAKWHSNCSSGDSTTEPYIVGHHQLLAHAAAVQVYRDKYQIAQKGQIGITLNCEWIVPASDSIDDSIAASRAVAFNYDWFTEPLSSGVYPIEMVNYVGERMPQFSRETSLMVKGSFDFIGVNYYTTKYATNIPCQNTNFSYFTDSCVKLASEHDGIPIGPKTGSDWLYVYPRGIHDLLLYTKYKFNNPIIYITENGVSDLDLDMVLLRDTLRIDYYNAHLSFMHKAITEGVNIKGFFAWSLLDNFEWSDGYTVRFGIVFVNYEDGLKRYPKESAMWFKKFLHSRNLNLLRSDIVDF